MGTVVLEALAIVLFGGAAMEIRRRRTSWHTVEAQQRALDTMGKLAAEHASSERFTPPTSAGRGAVRVVRTETGTTPGEGARQEPPAKPVLRSRPRHHPLPSPGQTVAGTSETVGGSEPASRTGKANGSSATTEPDRLVPRPFPSATLPSVPLPAGPRVRLVSGGDSVPSVPKETSSTPKGADASAPRARRARLPVIPAKELPLPPGSTLRFDELEDAAHPNDYSQADQASPLTDLSDQPSRAEPTGMAGVASDAWGPPADGPSRPRPASTTIGGQASYLMAPPAAMTKGSTWAVARRMAGAARLIWGRLHPRTRRLAMTGAAAAVAVVGLAGVLAGTSGSAEHPRVALRPAGHAPSLSPSSHPSTTPPPAPAVSLASSSPGWAAYHVEGPITVQLTATGRCWVEVRSGGPSGPLVWEGVLVTGESRTEQGPTWIRLGNPAAMTISIDGQVVTPDLPSGVPYDIQIG